MTRWRLSLKHSPDRGFILVVVLWSAVLLALLAAGFSASVRSHVRATAMSLERARAQALADGAINLALIDLAARHQDRTFEARFSDAENLQCRAESDATITVHIDDEAGKVNLNLASDRLLAAFFTGLGAAPEAAQQYANRIIDFRDSDDTARANSAEREAYLAAGQTPPKNGAFDLVDELDQVLGLPPEITAKAKIYATVYSGLAGVDPAKLRPQLNALLNAGAADPAAAASFDGQLPAGFSARSTQHAFTIYATARLASGVVYVSQAIVEFKVGAEPGYSLRQWRHGNAAAAGAVLNFDELDPPPC